jgi:hypothetical protein
MSVICNDFAWFRKDTLSSDGHGWSISDSAKTSQDINQAHLNIHASKVNVLILLLVLRYLKGPPQDGRFFIGF